VRDLPWLMLADTHGCHRSSASAPLLDGVEVLNALYPVGDTSAGGGYDGYNSRLLKVTKQFKAVTHRMHCTLQAELPRFVRSGVWFTRSIAVLS